MKEGGIMADENYDLILLRRAEFTLPHKSSLREYVKSGQEYLVESLEYGSRQR